MGDMHILVFMQGPYGERIFRNIKKRSPEGWSVESVTLPRAFPSIIDNPEEFISQDLPKADLILFLSESPQAPQLIPHLVDKTGAKAVIAPIDNSPWMPMGLKNQIKNELAGIGVASAFPKTFCTLTEDSYGYRYSAESYDDETIRAFAGHFGRPRMQIKVNPATKVIVDVEVERGSPCGSTHHAAEWLVGISADEAVPKAGLVCVHYPCQGSMQQEQIDELLYGTLMHLSGIIFNEEVNKHIYLED